VWAKIRTVKKELVTPSSREEVHVENFNLVVKAGKKRSHRGKKKHELKGKTKSTKASELPKRHRTERDGAIRNLY